MRERPSCLHKAADLLARRPHFRRELEQKLVRRGYPADEVATALERLATQGLLDDAELARDTVRSRLAREPIGYRRLQADLERHGAPREAIREALAELYPEDDRELAAAAAERWPRRRTGDPAALGRHLERLGFSRRAIVSVLRATTRETP